MRIQLVKIGHANSIVARVISYLSLFDFLTLEDGTDRLSRNVGELLPLRNTGMLMSP
jgi:hypothetical protein